MTVMTMVALPLDSEEKNDVNDKNGYSSQRQEDERTCYGSG
jgi:hypothetical protein